MSKITKSFRLDSEVIQSLNDLVNYYNQHLEEFSYKKATMTDIVSILILKEKEMLKKKNYNIR